MLSLINKIKIISIFHNVKRLVLLDPLWEINDYMFIIQKSDDDIV